MGARIFDGLMKHCRTDAGFAEVSDVQTMVLKDRMESFFLSETLNTSIFFRSRKAPWTLKKSCSTPKPIRFKKAVKK